MMEKSKMIGDQTVESAVKRKQRKRKFSEDVELKPQKKAMEKWLDRERDFEKLVREEPDVEKLKGPKSKSQEVSEHLVKCVPEKKSTEKSMTDLPDRHGNSDKKIRKVTKKNEQNIFKNSESLTRKVQQENLLREKVKLWDHHFTKEQAVMKKSGSRKQNLN